MGLPTRLGDEAGKVGLGQAEFVRPALPVLLEAIQLTQREVRCQGLPRNLVGGLTLGCCFPRRLIVELVGQGDGSCRGRLDDSCQSDCARGWR